MAGDDERRGQILSAAERLLCHYGPGKTTMAEIAREAAIGVGTVYLEFCSKDAIIEELSRQRHAALLAAMRAAAAKDAREHAARLRAALDAKVETLLGLEERGTHAADLVHCGKDAVQHVHAEFLAAERALVAELLADGLGAREFDVDDPAETASVLLRAYWSFAPPWLFKYPRDEVRRALRAMHELVLEGILRRPEGSSTRKKRGG